MIDQNSVNSSNRRRLLRATAVGLTGTGLFGSAAAQQSDDDPIVISEPITITEPGTYVLEEDIEYTAPESDNGSTSQPLIEIESYLEGDVIIEGNGNEISGQGSGTVMSGIEVYEASITVRNLTIREVGAGFSFDIGPTLDLEDITITDCDIGISGHIDNPVNGSNLTITENGSGIGIIHGYGTISDSTIADNEGTGLGITSSEITNTTISQNGTGVSIHLSAGATITDCTIQRNEGAGITAMETSDVTVTDSVISHNGQDGVHVFASQDWDIRQNTINQNEEYGVYIEGSDNTQVVDNTIVGNDNGPIFIDDDSEGTDIGDNRTNEQDPSNGEEDNEEDDETDDEEEPEKDHKKRKREAEKRKQKGHRKRKRKTSKSCKKRGRNHD